MAPTGERPLTARSVVASVLLGTEPPRLSGRRLARTAELFGISEGTTRVALSRMVTSGELVSREGYYELSGRLLDRRRRQARSRAADVAPWKGDWVLATVVAERRAADARVALRRAMIDLRLSELREGVWTRPDNLGAIARPDVAEDDLVWMTAQPEQPAALARELWDLDGWAAGAESLRARMKPLGRQLASGDTAALAPGFVLSASVLRHLQADPLLPPELTPARWPGAALRADYDRYDAAYRAVLASWLRLTTRSPSSQRDPTRRQ